MEHLLSQKEDGIRGKSVGASSGLHLRTDPPPSPPRHIGPSMRKVGPQHYLKEEMAAAREAVSSLDQAVAKASSYREKASRLLEEAHRALSRLEQV